MPVQQGLANREDSVMNRMPLLIAAVLAALALLVFVVTQALTPSIPIPPP
jgi:hypothetical protein